MRRVFNRGIEHKKARWGWFFVIPSLAFFAVFSFYPIMNAFYTSLFRKRLLDLRPPKFIGFANYEYLLKSPDFWNSVKATSIFTLGTFIPIVVFSLLLAVFIMSRRRFQKFFQIVYYSPAVLSSVVAAAIWLLIFDPRGLANTTMNTLLGTVGKDYKWLATAGMVRLSTILVYFWKYIGYFTIIYITGLAAIPQSLHEAAQIDGANGWKDFWHITLPLLKPTTVLVSIMSMLQCLKTFSTQYLFTQSGAPTQPINVITLNIYNTAIRDHDIGRASAMSIILFGIMLFFTWLQFRVSKSGGEVDY
ncbi:MULTISPECIES: sugar ABC transporter permease [Mesotoga]|uniref:carbohydrate ABC transporter permease n=2 Tax=Kosmotogaceae TaxID=1643948 RepID=UPI0002CA745B|nr:MULTISPECIES: sugar ABC transporter permease [Mesotoga]MCP5456501.1 sugar ABC transporter permease [Thermotogota bacterium]CCU85765.1 Binding-protein-dependent transport systems inner membrane component [Mesotoga infera]MCB1222790.1 sugar ABC transporter permease [Mesotoga sp.]MCP5460462.1 sugar ABC transporter permease [Thermotogota bacterium]HNQ70188.1 sugar ABC transporter permease [Mesotoga prima]